MLKILSILVAFLSIFSFFITGSYAAKLDSSPNNLAIATRYLINNIQVLETSVAGGTGAAFMTIQNPTGQDDVLISASSPQCESVEIHNMTIDDRGIMIMREIKDGLPLQAGQILQLSSESGLHLMLIKPHSILKPGQTISINLNFKNAPPQEVIATIEARSVKGTSPK